MAIDLPWPRQPQMPTYGTQAGYRWQGGPQGVHQGRGEGHGLGQKMRAEKVKVETQDSAIKKFPPINQYRKLSAPGTWPVECQELFLCSSK